MTRTYPYTIDNGPGERLTFTRLTTGPERPAQARGGRRGGSPCGPAAAGGRPDLFDIAHLSTRYRREFSLLEGPALMRRVLFPLLLIVGTVLGKFRKFRDAPPPAR